MTVKRNNPIRNNSPHDEYRDFIITYTFVEQEDFSKNFVGRATSSLYEKEFKMILPVSSKPADIDNTKYIISLYNKLSTSLKEMIDNFYSELTREETKVVPAEEPKQEPEITEFGMKWFNETDLNRWLKN